MNTRNVPTRRPGLLVSVRSEAEALAALGGGADVIDVKEPARGALGAADRTTIAAVVHAVAGRAPVTAAAGELLDVMRDGKDAVRCNVPRGVSLVKLGLAGCRRHGNWPSLWREAVEHVTHTRKGTEQSTRPVAVLYADWRAAGAPNPNEMLGLAVESCCPALLVDTWDKSCGGLLDDGPAAELAAFVRRVQSHRIGVVLAGSLNLDTIAAAVKLGPDLIAVRTAACVGGRHGAVASRRVEALQDAIVAAASPKDCNATTKKHRSDGAHFALRLAGSIRGTHGASAKEFS